MLKRCRALFRNGMYTAFRQLGVRFDTPEARAMLYAIAMQESRVLHRRQVGGPARSRRMGTTVVLTACRPNVTPSVPRRPWLSQIARPNRPPATPAS